jgi:hypothetical protein
MRAHRLTFFLAVLFSSGCGEDIPGPTRPDVLVSVFTIGVDRDADGYLVHAGDSPATVVPAEGTVGLLLEAGTYDVWLDGVAPNCTLQSPASVRVTIAPDEPDPVVEFRLECRAVTAAVEVAAPTSGRDFDPDGYTVILDKGSPSFRIATLFPDGTVTLESLAPGTHVVALENLSDNCALSGSSSIEFGVIAGGLTRDTARIVFGVSCQAVTGDVRLSTVTTGDDRDVNGYTLHLDGEPVVEIPYDFYGYGSEAPIRLGPNDSRFFERIPPGPHTYELTDIAPNCAVSGSNPRPVSVTVGATSDFLFHVVCTDVP